MKVPAHKTKIMVHCLATTPKWGYSKTAETMVNEVTRWHVDPPPHGRGWSAIAYAEIIDYEGRRAKGRDLNNDGNTFDDTGAGARGHNRDTIHIALAGGRWPDGRWGERTDRFSDHFTPEQDRALREIIVEINQLAGRKLKVLGHNEVSSKGCPGFDVQEWLKSAPQPSSPAAAGRQATSAGTDAPPAATRNPIVALLNAIFKALGLGKGGPA